jgi:acetoin utilization protein AcuB
MGTSNYTVEKHMTTTPHTIGSDQTLEKAHHMMREYKIRHLPVLKGGKLVGILSDRDLHLVESLPDVDPAKITVEEAYTPDPFITSPGTSLKVVCEEMMKHKYGSALVVDKGQKLLGIFTWIDALKVLTTLVK